MVLIALRTFLLVLVAAAVAACGLAGMEPNTRIDGWSVGESIACEASTPDCTVLFPLAIETFDVNEPDHASIVSTSLHEEGLYPNERGELVQIIRSTARMWVVVFQLADGSRRAIGVANILGDPTVFWEGPNRVP